jgi:hypothetical protein
MESQIKMKEIEWPDMIGVPLCLPPTQNEHQHIFCHPPDPNGQKRTLFVSVLDRAAGDALTAHKNYFIIYHTYSNKEKHKLKIGAISSYQAHAQKEHAASQ